jgi:uncharacterized RDD family membrane protein YckC
MTEQQRSYLEAVSGPAEAADLWRNEVQDRLARYKRRGGRRIEGAYTMRFPFPVDEVAEPGIPTEAADAVADPVNVHCEESSRTEATSVDPRIEEPSESAVSIESSIEQAAATPEATIENIEVVLESLPAPEDVPAPYVDTVSRPRPKRKVIAFPRQLSVSPETAYRLADPVTAEVPRILDVPEELESTPFLDGLQVDLPKSQRSESDREHVDLPFRSVRIAQRVLAGIVDLAVIGCGFAVFAAVAFRIINEPPITKPLIIGMAAAAVVLWSAYQYLFVVHAGKTLGMMAARIRLRTFKGKAPTMRQRRNRVLGFYLSAFSLAMGLMWGLVDVDALCWHDRLSRTYLSDRE